MKREHFLCKYLLVRRLFLMMLELINMKILSLIFIYGKKEKRAAESEEKRKNVNNSVSLHCHTLVVGLSSRWSSGDHPTSSRQRQRATSEGDNWRLKSETMERFLYVNFLAFQTQEVETATRNCSAKKKREGKLRASKWWRLFSGSWH